MLYISVINLYIRFNLSINIDLSNQGIRMTRKRAIRIFAFASNFNQKQMLELIEFFSHLKDIYSQIDLAIVNLQNSFTKLPCIDVLMSDGKPKCMTMQL